MASGLGKLRWKLPIFAALLLAVFAVAIWYFSDNIFHTSLRDLQDVPVGHRVRIAGVINYLDRPAGRAWIQDETGAIPLELKMDGLVEGHTISVTALKTRRFESTSGPVSVGLVEAHITEGFTRLKVPGPVSISVDQFPTKDKNGIRIQTTGIVRSALVDEKGFGQIVIAAGSSEVTITVAHPAGDYAHLVNGEVRVTGVPEFIDHPVPLQPQRRIWISSQDAIELTHFPPAEPLYSSRSIYLDPKVRAGHRVRVRGRLSTAPEGTINVDDRFGITPSDIPASPDLPVGTPVEASGFPTIEPRGVRIALLHATVHRVPENVLDEADSNPGLPLLTTVRSIRELTSEQAARVYPVRLHGVITYIDNIWAQMFLQDETGGIYVKLASQITAHAGDLVTLYGLSNPGNFAPIVVAPRIQVDGKAPFPPALNLTSSMATSGGADSQFVTLEGVVRPVKIAENPTHAIVTFELLSPIGRVHVYTSPEFHDVKRARELEDATVQLRGVFGSVFNARRQLIGYQLLVQEPSAVQILEPSVQSPFSMQGTPIADLLRYSPQQRNGHRVKVSGVVTLVAPDHLYVQDATGGLEIRADAGAIKVGEIVHAVGYPALVGRYSPVMTDAVLTSEGRKEEIQPRAASADSVLQDQNDSTLVSVEGRLRMAMYDPSRVTLVLQSGVRTFTARIDSTDRGDDLRNLREGSYLRLTGVCSMQTDPNRLYAILEEGATSFEIVLRSDKDVVVIRQAPFWNTKSTLAALAICALVLPGVVMWVVVLRRRVRQQNAALDRAAETAQAIHDLSHSMQTVTRDKRFDTRVSVRGSQDVARLVVGFNRMLSELQQHESDKLAAEAKLQHMAMVDELTTLPNRRMLFDRLAQSLARARRLQHNVGLLYLDLDGFKGVNDNLGHTIGDVLLTEVALRLRARTRTSDTLARIGGDEFIVLLEEVNTVDDVLVFARDLIEVLEQPFDLVGHSMRISASIGIAMFPEHAHQPDTLLQHADCAMYAAKNNGKNQIVVFGDELGNAARERLTLESELRKAVANKSLTVHYQPEFDLTTGRIVRFEALARWQHPELGSVSPAQFIPIAEESGLIVALGSQIMSAACTAACQWNLEQGRAIQVAVNVSTVQFARNSFVEEVAQVLRETGLPPSLLQIELTESVNLAGIERASHVLRGLNEMGVSVAVDDFGTGYSCLSYLPRLAFEAIKIDRSFVNECMSNPENVAFMRSIIEMAHNLQMRVIVEGIETEMELRAFGALGADEGQGYLLGRPGDDPSRHFDTEAGVHRMIADVMQDKALDQEPISTE